MNNDTKVLGALEYWYSREVNDGCKQAEAAEFTPSVGFLSNMNLILDGMAAPPTVLRKRVIKRRIAALVAAAILIAALAIGSYAGREAIGRLFFKSFEAKTSIIYCCDGKVPVTMSVSLECIPDGYSLKSESNKKTYAEREYANADTGGRFMLICTPADSPIIDVDAENSDYERITVNGHDAVLYESDSLISLYMFSGNVIVNVSGKLPRADLISIASGVILTENLT